MKKFLSFLFLLLLGRNGAQASSPVWNGKADTKWYNDSLSEFIITTPEQLAGLAKLVNNGNNFMRKTVKLGANIMLNDTANWRNWAKKAPKNKWKPIGFEKYTDGGHIGPIKLGNLIFNPFCGTFDGSGFAVSGVYVKSREGSQGLFGYFMGEIKNLGVVASYIEGSGNVGTHAGISNGGTISNSYSMALVVGHGYSGGLVGSNSNDDSKIINSYSVSIVTGKNRVIGGLVGLNKGIISNSYFATVVPLKNNSLKKRQIDNSIAVFMARLKTEPPFRNFKPLLQPEKTNSVLAAACQTLSLETFPGRSKSSGCLCSS